MHPQYRGLTWLSEGWNCGSTLPENGDSISGLTEWQWSVNVWRSSNKAANWSMGYPDPLLLGLWPVPEPGSGLQHTAERLSTGGNGSGVAPSHPALLEVGPRRSVRPRCHPAAVPRARGGSPELGPPRTGPVTRGKHTFSGFFFESCPPAQGARQLCTLAEHMPATVLLAGSTPRGLPD